MTDHKEQGVYTVIISTLTQDDAGGYQCAVKDMNNDSSTDCLTKIQLHILSKYWSCFIHPVSKLTKTTHAYKHLKKKHFYRKISFSV